MAITERLSSNDAVNAIALAIAILPGGAEALEASIAKQIADMTPVEPEEVSLDDALAAEVVESTVIE